jgi:serpin B
MKLRFAAAVLALVLASCGGSPSSGALATSRLDRRSVAFEPAKAGAFERFSDELYGAVASTTDGNVAMSPYSALAALMMVRAGARGTTRSQLDQALRIGDAADADALFNAVDAQLASRNGTIKTPAGGSARVRLSTANSVWAQSGYPFETPFLDRLALDYGAGVHVVDYRRDPASARRSINAWVAKQTEDKIPELIPKGVLDALTRLVLTNAIYLNAPWRYPFDPAHTRDDTFNLFDGSRVTTPFMHASESFSYATGAGWQALRIPYVDPRLALEIVLPDDGRFDQIEAQVSAGHLATGAFHERSVALSLPRFSVRSQINLVDALRSLGIVDLFDGTADLSGITSAEALFVSDVLHEAYLAIDERGTEAAAATAVVIKATAAPDIVEFTVDRPFLFRLIDVPTATVLFLGRIANPVAR